jgi:hypothetical protein
VAALQTQLTTVQNNPALALGPYVSVTTDSQNGVVGPNIIFTGANIHIRSGSGSTSDGGTLTGRGNLIIGYDESQSGANGARSGSHNLVMGPFNAFLAYGGLVAGELNIIDGPLASVTGGFANEARGDQSVVIGGNNNHATATDSILPQPPFP